MKRAKELQEFIDNIFKEERGKSLTETQEERICSWCHKPITDFRNILSAKEYTISGFCQECQDAVFGKD